jgi:hypothetical protein
MRPRATTYNQLVDLANTLLREPDLIEWMAGFRSRLMELFVDVDRVSIHIDRTAALSGVVPTSQTTSTVHIYRPNTSIGETITVTSDGPRGAARAILTWERAGLPLDDYHTPVFQEYATATGYYLGSVFLWRAISAPPISTESRILFESIRGFLAFAISAAIARFQTVHLSFMQAATELEETVVRAKLTKRQREVLLCKFNGRTAGETAWILSIAESTVRRHLRSIHRRLADTQMTSAHTPRWHPRSRPRRARVTK